MGEKLDAIDKVKAGAEISIYEIIPDNEKPRKLLTTGDTLKFEQCGAEYTVEYYVEDRCWFSKCDYCKHRLHKKMKREIRIRKGLDGKEYHNIRERTVENICPNCMHTTYL